MFKRDDFLPALRSSVNLGLSLAETGCVCGSLLLEVEFEALRVEKVRGRQYCCWQEFEKAEVA